MKKLIFIIAVISFFTSIGFAQERGSVKLLAKVKSNSILLRWAPTDPTTWNSGNTNGYQIERYTIAKGTTILSKPEKLILTKGPFKPKPLEQWKNDAMINKYSAIAAQAIYGKSFQVAASNPTDIAQIVNQSREQEQRFSFALFAADQSFTTAKLSGLGLKDSTVKKDERYLYRVIVLANDTKIKIDTALFYIGLKDSVGLTPPINLQAKFGDRSVHLRWPRFAVEKEYTSFIIERAEGKSEFKRINTLPFINTLSKEETHFQAMDSLSQNGIDYQYRVRGLTPFGEVGPESERVSGKGFKLLNATAAIKSAKEDKEKIAIRWAVSGDQNSITGFYVERSRTVSGTFETLHKNALGKTVLKYSDDKPLSTNYYRIKIVGENSQENFSFPYLAQLTDSVPPAPPQGLKVLIDTMGIAKLTWTANKENDLLGYRIYRSNFANAEYSQINRDPLPSITYKDSVNIRRLNSKIYYKLVAVDKRFNPSDYSTPVIVELPDVIPPLPPVIESIRSTSTGVKITWTPSASDDVVSYRLVRRPLNSISWDTIKVVKAQDSLLFTDRNLEVGREYQYSTMAIDKAKLKSPLCSPVIGRLINNLIKSAITEFKAEVDRTEKSITLRWKYNEKNVIKFLIYRAVNDEPLSLYKSVPGNSFSMKDVNLRMNSNYNYRVKAVFKDGVSAEFSREVKLSF
ncbi:MAG: fibronectin type III domain-containing protein [Cyclobacteriaceae bacterium]